VKAEMPKNSEAPTQERIGASEQVRLFLMCHRQARV